MFYIAWFGLVSQMRVIWSVLFILSDFQIVYPTKENSLIWIIVGVTETVGFVGVTAGIRDVDVFEPPRFCKLQKVINSISYSFKDYGTALRQISLIQEYTNENHS